MKVRSIARLSSLRSVPEKIIEAADKPLLALAVVAVGLYLLELRGLLAQSGPARVVSLSLDALFIVDFLLKLIFLRGRYLRSAWVATDFLSCLPGARALHEHAVAPGSAACADVPGPAGASEHSVASVFAVPARLWPRRRRSRTRKAGASGSK